ncbi:MAG TPA: archease [Candidatus Binataceae bacterium]
MAAEEFFREFEHTGDLGIEVFASSRAELLARAAIAMSQLMVEAQRVRSIESRQIEVYADSDADLIHDLLAGALNLFLGDGFIWRDVKIEEANKGVTADFSGEMFDPERHNLLTEIKAVTYHQLSVVESPSDWRARIIFDV